MEQMYFKSAVVVRYFFNEAKSDQIYNKSILQINSIFT